MAIINMTPHVIRVVTGAVYSEKVRKYLATSETKVVKEIPPSGKLLNAKREPKVLDPIDGVPTIKMVVTGVDQASACSNGLAFDYNECQMCGQCDYFIVSAMYVAAAQQMGFDTSHFLTVGEAVYEGTEPKPIGVLNLNRN